MSPKDLEQCLAKSRHSYLPNIVQDGQNTSYVNIYNELQIFKEHKVEVWVHLKMITDLAFTHTMLYKSTDTISKSKLTMHKTFNTGIIKVLNFEAYQKLAKSKNVAGTTKLFKEQTLPLLCI